MHFIYVINTYGGSYLCILVSLYCVDTERIAWIDVWIVGTADSAMISSVFCLTTIPCHWQVLEKANMVINKWNAYIKLIFNGVIRSAILNKKLDQNIYS